MIDTPTITESKPQHVAFIHLTISRTDIQNVMGPGIQEVLGAVAAQGLTPTGPWFTHHLRFPDGKFDFEICVPVAKPISPVGRVQAGKLPAMKVARTVYHGGYEGLPTAGPELDAWIKSIGHSPMEELWEVYAKGPESSPDPKMWQTELNRPLAK